jgi:ribosomal protein L3
VGLVHDHEIPVALPQVRVDKENNLLLVKGSIPGPNGGYVVVRQAKAKK